MAKVSASVAEFVFGFVMAHFGDQLDTCFADQRRPAKDLPLIDGRRVPSPRLLSVFVVAARQEASLETALERTKGPDAEWLRDLQKASEELTYCMFYGRDFTRSLLTELANGLGADAAQREALLKHCSGRGSDGTPDPDMIEMVLHQQRTEAQLPDSAEVPATATQRALPDQQCLDFCVRSAARLSQLPPYYPRHLTVGALAQRLTASVLDDGWEKGYAKEAGLYSGMSRHSDTPATELVLQHRRSVLLGDPGHGKSTVLSACCLGNIAEGRLTLFARLDDLGDLAAAHTSRRALDPEHAAALVVDAASAFSGVVCPSDVRDRLVESIMRDDTFLLALDGLDEIVEQSSRAAAEAVLVALADIPGTIAIASRITGYTKPRHDAPELLVNQMAGPAVKDFVRSWFTVDQEPLRDRTLTALGDSDLSTLARIPLLAGFICYVSTHEAAKSTKHGLYQQYLGLFFERRWKPAAQHRVSAKENRRILDLATAVAWTMATRPAVDPADPPLWADHISLRELGFEPDIPGDVAELTETDGLLIPHGQLRQGDRQGQQYRWLHRTIHEHLVGRALAERIVRDFDSTKDILRTAALRPVWIVALQHCAGILGASGHEAIDYLFELHTTEDTLGNAFANALSHYFDSCGISYRRHELVRELFGKGSYLLAGKLDQDLTYQLVREHEPDPLKVYSWELKYLGTEYSGRHVDRLEKMAKAEPRQYTDKWLEFLTIVDKKRAQVVTIEAYLNNALGYIWGSLFEDSGPDDASWLLEKIPNATLSLRILDLVELIASIGDESTLQKLTDITATRGAAGTLLLNYYNENVDGHTGPSEQARQRMLKAAFEHLNRSYLNELGCGTHGRSLAFLSGFTLGEDAVESLETADPWVQAGALLGKLRDDDDYTILYNESDWDAARACSLIIEIEKLSEVDLATTPEGAINVEDLINFHAAAEWATERHVTQALPPLLTILDNIERNLDYIDIPLSHPSWITHRVLRYSWPDFFDAYRSHGFPNRKGPGKYFFSRREEILRAYVSGSHWQSNSGYDHERFCQLIEWFVNSETPSDFLPFDLLDAVNPDEYADDLISIAQRGSNEQNKMYVLGNLEQWVTSADRLPRHWKTFATR